MGEVNCEAGRRSRPAAGIVLRLRRINRKEQSQTPARRLQSGPPDSLRPTANAAGKPASLKTRRRGGNQRPRGGLPEFLADGKTTGTTAPVLVETGTGSVHDARLRFVYERRTPDSINAGARLRVLLSISRRP
jgi:hypothetical protein